MPAYAPNIDTQSNSSASAINSQFIGAQTRTVVSSIWNRQTVEDYAFVRSIECLRTAPITDSFYYESQTSNYSIINRLMSTLKEYYTIRTEEQIATALGSNLMLSRALGLMAQYLPKYLPGSPKLALEMDDETVFVIAQYPEIPADVVEGIDRFYDECLFTEILPWADNVNIACENL